MQRATILLIFFVIFPFLNIASEKVVISGWLTTSPLEVNYPVFHDAPDVEGNTFSVRQLLIFDHIDLKDYYPEEGKKLLWLQDISAKWAAQATDAEGYVLITEDTVGNQAEIAYLAAYIRADRWVEGQLELSSPYPFEAWLNGKKIGTKSTIEGKNRDDESEGQKDEDTDDVRKTYGSVRHPLQLPLGTHLLIIKTLRPPENGPGWEFMGSITVNEPFVASTIKPVTTPKTIKNIHHFMDGIKVTSVRPSPDGRFYAISYRQSLPPSDRSETWTDIHRFSDDAIVHSFRHATISRLTWLPATNAVSYTSVRNGRTTLHWQHMETGEKRMLMEDIEDFAGMQWSPDETYLVYTIREEGSGADANMRHILGMQDRQAHFRHRSFLYMLDVNSGARTRLTHGNLTTSLHDISPDGCCIVFSQTRPDYMERPYYKTDIFLMNMQNFAVDTLFADKRWSVSLRFSPDGWYLLATGGPSAFDRIGENIPEEMIANNYDTQAYIYSLADRSVKPITYDFDPSVSSVYWHAPDNIYMLAGEEDYRRLFRYNVRRERFDRIDTGTDFLININFARNAQIATYIGNEVNAPPRAYRLNTRNDRYSTLKDTDTERYRHVQFGEVHNWDFSASTGAQIKGRYYLPPDFDPDKQYPLIVYQYGGTNPVGRTFGGRYPFNLWAGNGYIVYVVQPSGATGFGQEFSAAHVNNWGKTVADEIIEGTKKFLEAHPFIDPDRVGVAGASYGGFMTMLLLTQTDIYATGISHAGISNIASYWGEGYWGYSYSAEASAKSFPWDSPEVYIDQSPLYSADKINTPLLLITGDSDTNVPPGESIQMYTALKLLGRPVELILVKGENHHILTYNRRLEWHDTIMAWWDKYLKGQPEWWEKQYPEKNY